MEVRSDHVVAQKNKQEGKKKVKGHIQYKKGHKPCKHYTVCVRCSWMEYDLLLSYSLCFKVSCFKEDI